MTSSERISQFYNGLIWVCGAFLVFILPWLLPSHTPVVSDSYTVGFNNKVSVLGVGVTLVAFTLFYLSARQRETTESWRRRLFKLLRPSHVKPVEYAVPLIYAALQSVLMWGLYQILTYNTYGEMSYPIGRIELVLLGQIPYRDFQWNYGAFFLYLPALIVWASNYQMSSDVAYMLTLIISTFLGFVGVYYVIAQLRTTRWHRVLIFIMVCSTFNLALGSNSVHLRFITPFVALFFLHRCAPKGIVDLKKRIQFGALAVMLILLCFFISPECGVGFCPTLVAYCFGRIRNKEFWYLWCALLAPLTSLLVLSGLSSDYLQSIGSFGSGGSNFPIVPSPHILLFLLSLGYLVPLLLACAWRSKLALALGDKTGTSALIFGLCVMMVFYTAAALGRCDPHHVLFNGFGVFLLMLALCFRLKRPYVHYRIAFFVFFTCGYLVMNWKFHEGWLMANAAAREKGVTKIDRNFFLAGYEKRNPELRKWHQQLAPFKQIGSPLGVGEDIDLVIKYGRLYTREYYPMPDMEVRTLPEIARRVEEVRQMPYVMVRTQWLNAYLQPINRDNYERGHSAFLTGLFMFPVPYKIKFQPLSAERELAKFIQANFVTVKTIESYSIMKNKALK